MFPIFLAVLLAFLGLVAGYLINQLPGFKNFPGKNAFILRVLGEVVVLIIVLTYLLRAILWSVNGSIRMANLYQLEKLCIANN
jgi:hypothetical protein